MVQVANGARPRIEAMLNYPGMRQALSAVNVRYFGELIPGQPKITTELQNRLRERMALANTFRERHEFFPDNQYRRNLRIDLETARKTFGNRDEVERLEVEQKDLIDIVLVEKKIDDLNRANFEITEAWQTSIIKSAPQIPGEPQETQLAWGAGDRLTYNASQAMQLAPHNLLEVTGPQQSPEITR